MLFFIVLGQGNSKWSTKRTTNSFEQVRYDHGRRTDVSNYDRISITNCGYLLSLHPDTWIGTSRCNRTYRDWGVVAYWHRVLGEVLHSDIVKEALLIHDGLASCEDNTDE